MLNKLRQVFKNYIRKDYIQNYNNYFQDLKKSVKYDSNVTFPILEKLDKAYSKDAHILNIFAENENDDKLKNKLIMDKDNLLSLHEEVKEKHEEYVKQHYYDKY